MKSCKGKINTNLYDYKVPKKFSDYNCPSVILIDFVHG